MKSTRLAGIGAALLVGALAGCNNTPQAVGNVSSIIVITTDSLWRAIGDSLMKVLEPQIFTVRNERAFELTQVSPQDPKWNDGREFRQILVIGTAQDGWVAPVLKKARAEGVAAPAVVQTRDVWARNQFATALVVPAAQSAAAALAEAPRLAAKTDSLFRAYARERMYTSKPDTLLRDSLRAQSGYGITLPNVYSSVHRTTETQVFQNSTELGGDLIRSVLVATRPGLVEPTSEAALAWRDSLAQEAYRPAQTTERAQLLTREVRVGSQPGLEVQGVWRGSDPSWPAGGPFIARVVHCPSQNRTYLLDGWLFAPGPGRGSKYEYMIQLQTILDSFECAPARAARGTRSGTRLVTR